MPDKGIDKIFPKFRRKCFIFHREARLIKEATVNITWYNWQQLKRKQTSLSVSIKLQQKSTNKLQLVVICFDKISLSIICTYHAQKHPLQPIH